MPKLFSAAPNVTGQIQSRGATPNTFGADIGAAVAGFGGSVTAVGKVLNERSDRRSITDARAKFADFKIQSTQNSIQRQADDPLSGGYFDRERDAYDDEVSNFSSGLSQVALDALAAEMGTHKAATLTGALRFQAQETITADTAALSTIGTSLNADVFGGRTTVQEAINLYSIALADTTLNQNAQNQLLTKALPAFRSQLTNGLLAQPMRGHAALKAGDLDFLPKEELDKFENDLEDVFKGMEKRADTQRLVQAATDNSELYAAVLAGDVGFEELSAYVGKVPTEFYNHLFESLKGSSVPKRTLEEQRTATATLTAEYNGFRIRTRGGRQEYDASLEDILRFQREVTKQVADGFVTSGHAMTWLNRTQGIAQELAGDHRGTGVIKFRESAFDRGMDAIIAMKLDPAPMGQVLERFQALLDESGLADQGDTDERNNAVRAMVVEAQMNYVRETVPSVATLPDVPNAVLRSNGTFLPGLIGSRDLKPDRTITTNTEVMVDDKGNYARVTKLANGSTNVQEITQAQALSLGAVPPKPKATSTPIKGGATAPIPGTETDAAAIVFDQLTANEGVSDDVTGTPTGRLGVTDARKLDAEKTAGRPLSDEDAARQILHDDSALLHNDMAGFSTLNHKVQAAILDLSYNVGADKVADSLLFSALARAVATGDVPSILLQTLDTAVIDGKTVKGLAGRRARMYNSAVSDGMDKIVSVEQAPDGTIIYNAAPSETAASYVLSKFTLPRHKDSRAGTLSGPNFSPSSTRRSLSRSQP